MVAVHVHQPSGLLAAGLVVAALALACAGGGQRTGGSGPELARREPLLPPAATLPSSSPEPGPTLAPPAAATPVRPFPSGARVTRDPETGAIRWLRGDDLSRDLESDAAFRTSQMQGRAEAVARAFVGAYAGQFRLESPDQELLLRSIDSDGEGRTRVNFAQTWRGLPVLRAELRVHLDRGLRVLLVNGDTVPTPSGVEPTPALAADDARARAAEAQGRAGEPCALCPAELVVFAGRASPSRLAWRVRPTPGAIQAREVLVDAASGAILESLPAAIPAQPALRSVEEPR